MQVSQLQVANDSVQDRLVLRIASSANEEIRVFFTRRFLRELWPLLATTLAGHLASGVLPPGEKLADGEPASFDKSFRDDNPTYPLGANPLLASEATIDAAGDGQARLTLREGRERHFNLNLNSELLQALCAMLRAASEQAKWDLTLDYAASAPTRPTAAKSKLLH